MLSEEDVGSEIQTLLEEKLLLEVKSWETDLLEAGILDSLSLVQLLMHLDERFGFKVAMEEYRRPSLDSFARPASCQATHLRGCVKVKQSCRFGACERCDAPVTARRQ